MRASLLKRPLDLLLGAVLVILATPFFLAIALAIRCDSAGPALFRQRRVGKDGRSFTMLKFRTMRLGAQEGQGDLQAQNVVRGPAFKVPADPRVTRIGAFLRRYFLDELPQVFNVLAGHMSLVGPRPALPEEVAQYKAWQRGRLAMRPGMTGLWQVRGRDLPDFDDWVRMDIAYIEGRSFFQDLHLLCATIPLVLRGRGR